MKKIVASLPDDTIVLDSGLCQAIVDGGGNPLLVIAYGCREVGIVHLKSYTPLHPSHLSTPQAWRVTSLTSDTLLGNGWGGKDDKVLHDYLKSFVVQGFQVLLFKDMFELAQWITENSGK